MESLELAADLVQWVPEYAGLALGFFLLAIGFPLSSLALFGALGGLAAQTGLPWWVAGALAGVTTALGHWFAYVAFARLGQPYLHVLTARFPSLAPLIARLGLLLEHKRPWWTLFVLRWIGPGYAQVFWVLGATGTRWPRLMAFFLVTDFTWGLIWTYATVGLPAGLPCGGRKFIVCSLVLLAAPLIVGCWRRIRSGCGGSPAGCTGKE